jgi:hypothetical protein
LILLPIQASSRDSWSATLLRYVDKGLDAFGESTKRVVYWNFEINTHFAKNQIPEHLDEFSRSLDAMFGDGSGSIKRRIAKETSISLNLSFGENDDFVTFLVRARKELQSKMD